MSSAPLRLKPYLTPTQRPTERLRKGKAVTIGVGFFCQDGIVICSDNQVTWEDSHKDYKRKILIHDAPEWITAFTYAGSPEVMECFFEKFEATAATLRPPFTVAKIHEAVETVLFCMDILDNQVNQLQMICGISILNGEWKLLRTEQKVVRKVSDYGYVGCGEGSLLRFLGRILCGDYTEFKIRHAMMLGVYLTMKARTHVDGCGGDTEGIILRPNSGVEGISPNLIYRAEQDMLLLEKRIKLVVGALYDKAASDDLFAKLLDQLDRELKQQHFQMGIYVD